MSKEGKEAKKVMIFSTGAKGGVGKSTMAVLLIEALREAGQSVAGIEGDEHSPTLVNKYGRGSINIAQVDLAGLVDRSGLVAFSDAVRDLKEDWIVVNTPASGARIFDEQPEALAMFNREIRAVWSLSINADRNEGGIENDGLLTSVDVGMLSSVADGYKIAVKQPFQLAYRGQKCWYDGLDETFRIAGVEVMTIEKMHPSLVERIQRDSRSIPEIITELNATDPLVGASLQLFWRDAKNEMHNTILSDVDLIPVVGLERTKGKLFGPGGLLAQERSGSESDVPVDASGEGSAQAEVD